MIDHGADVVRIGGHQVERSTLKGIQTASADSGVSFHYLLAKAAQESGFDSGAQVKTSTAAGLFQFTRGTWLDMMRRYDAELGFGDLAAQVKESATGRLTVLNEDAEIEMLALRRNPDVSSQMAALFAGDNANTLKTALGRDATPGELYLAHLLGARGATALMTAAEQDPHKPAAELLPAAAHANKTVFFSAGGLARTAEGVIDWLKNKFADRLDETSDVASMFDPMRARDWTAEKFQPQIENPNSPFDLGAAARSGDAGSMGISLYLLQMLSDMFAAQPMQMMDDPFVTNNLLPTCLGRVSHVLTAPTPLGSSTALALRCGRGSQGYGAGRLAPAAQSSRPRWLHCERVTQKPDTSGATLPMPIRPGAFTLFRQQHEENGQVAHVDVFHRYAGIARGQHLAALVDAHRPMGEAVTVVRQGLQPSGVGHEQGADIEVIGYRVVAGLFGYTDAAVDERDRSATIEQAGLQCRN